jgi:glycosyltransferase involved in cell wall biosynthesis
VKILVLDQFSDPGGAQRSLAEFLPEMSRYGWKGAVALPGGGELFETAREAGFATDRIEMHPYRSGRKTLSDAAHFALDTPRLARHIRALAEREHADVLYINGPRLLPATAWARTGRPVVFHSHSYLGPGLVQQIAGIALREMDAHVIAQCEFVASAWRTFVDEDRLNVIYNGVAGPRWRRAKRANGPPRIGCIGRIAPEKGQLEFIEAAAQIHRALPECRFVVYGAVLFGQAAPTEYAERVRTAAEGLPIEFAGWTGDVHSAMAELDLLLVPSAPYEATTRVIPEAFASALPVIAFRSGGIPEIIDNGVDGLLARDAEDMADLAIVLLTGDPRRLISIAHCARETWERRFMLERYHRELLRAIEVAAGVRPPLAVGQ